MANNYSTYSDFYKVSFITTSSINIPKLLKQTGGLIVMNNTDNFTCAVNPTHGVHHPKSLWFRGDMIASGYGALCQEERENLTYLAGTYASLFNGIHERFEEQAYYINSYNAYFLDAYSYTVDTIDRVKKESYYYTDKQIENLIGCAPNTLDTLGEIAHWLEHDKTIGLDTISHVKSIASSYVWHYDEEEPSYWYTRKDTDKEVLNEDKYCYIGDWGLEAIEITSNYTPSHYDNDEYVIIDGEYQHITSNQKITYQSFINDAGNYSYVIPIEVEQENGEIVTKYHTCDGKLADMTSYQYSNSSSINTVTYVLENSNGIIINALWNDETSTYVDTNYITIDSSYTPMYQKCSYDPGFVSDTYSSFETKYSGILAMKDYQISTHYSYNPTLGTVLNCLLDPYEYKESIVYMISYKPIYAEIGTTVQPILQYYYEVNDANNLTNIYNKKVNFTYMESGVEEITNPTNISISKHGKNSILSSYSYVFTDAKQAFYPQLLKANIEQTCDEGKWTTKKNTKKVNSDVFIYGLYMLYGGALNENDNIPTTISKETSSYKYIYDFDETDSFIVNVDMFSITEENVGAWLAIPKYYNFNLYLRNIHTDIMQPLSLNNQNNILEYTSKNYTMTGLGTEYYICSFTSNRFNMANDYELVVELTAAK